MTDVNDAPPESRAALIEYEIVETRNRMGDELGEIGDRLRPERIKQRAKAAVSRKGSNMLRTIKENPLPSAIVALGLGLLFRAAKQRETENGDSERISSRYGREYGQDEGSHGQGGLKEKTQELAGTAKQKVQDVAGAVGEKVGHAGEQVAEKAKRTGNKLQEFFETNPIIAGAGVVVLGAAIGALIPETQKENRLMGRAKDELAQKAKSVAQHAQGAIEQKMSEQHPSSQSQGKSQSQSQGQGQYQGGGIYGNRG